jgi:hypothetical protein
MIETTEHPPGRYDGWRFTLGAFVVVEMLAGVLSVVRAVIGGMPETFDLGNYEYYSGFAALHGWRSPIALPGLLQTYLDPQLNTIYYLLISHLHARPAVAAIALLQSLPVSLVAILVWKLARRAGGSPVASAIAGFLAGTGAIFAPIYGSELGETSSDALLALPLVAAVALLYRCVAVPGTRRAGWRDSAIAGLLLGIAGALKFTTAPFAVAILVGFFLALLVGRSRPGWDLRRCLLLGTLPAAAALVSAAAIYLPTALLLWHRYHDPVFPYFNSIFHSADLLPGSYRDQRWTARTPMSFLLHYTRLLVGGDNYRNGTSQWPVRSPVMFFGIAASAVALVAELVRRHHPEALFLELSLVGGFALSEAVFGIYRYLAPIEMSAAAVVISLIFIYRRRPASLVPLLTVLAVGLAMGSLFALQPKLGATEGFGPSYFDVPPRAFSHQARAGVVIAGPGPLGYLVPYIPASTELVRTGGNLDEVMSDAWWAHVADVVRASGVRWWVVYQTGTVKKIPAALRQIGFSGAFRGCRPILTRMAQLTVCPLPPPAR